MRTVSDYYCHKPRLVHISSYVTRIIHDYILDSIGEHVPYPNALYPVYKQITGHTRLSGRWTYKHIGHHHILASHATSGAQYHLMTCKQRPVQLRVGVHPVRTVGMRFCRSDEYDYE